MSVAYEHGMPTPPLSRKPSELGQSFHLRSSSSFAYVDTGTDVKTGSSYPEITPEQDLLRLTHHLSQLPTPLLKHVHLQRVRRQNPNLFFAALANDINKL